ncbi:11321_t:CDS:2, partial [Racocetra persica]
NHPLARLWNISDADVPEWLESERNLVAIDDILRPILEDDSFISSFGGTYIDIFSELIIVNTVDFSKVNELLALPQIKPYKKLLYFREANNSMSQLKHNFREISYLARFLNAVERFHPAIFYVNEEPLSVPQTIIRPRSGVVGNYDSALGDSGGSVVSFVSPQDLNLVVLHGKHSNGGGGVSASQSIDTIFNDLEKSNIRYLNELILYLGDS